MLFLRTFGGLALEKDCEPVAGASAQRTRLAILAVLAAAGAGAGARGVSRDRLLTLFWPESSDERARGALKQALYAMRRDLAAPELTLGTAELRLNPEVVDSDVAAFTAGLAAQDPERAIAHYAGPFLDGVHLGGVPEFDRWAERERERLRVSYRDALEGLAAAAEARRDERGAVRWWKQLTVADPLSAAVATGLLRALVRAGDRPAALQYARVYESLVRTELEAPPEPAFVALAAAIRAGEPVPGAPPPVGAPGPGSPSVAIEDTGAPPSATDGTEDGEAPVAPEQEEVARTPDRAATIAIPRMRHRLSSVPAWPLGAALIVALGAGTVLRDTSGREQEDPVLRFHVEFGGSLSRFTAPLALSPDGRLLVLVGQDNSSERRLWIRTTQDLIPRELPGTEGAEQPFFSPDGRWIGFYQRPLLKKVPVTGGTPVVIGEVRDMRGASWGAPDRIVVSTEGVLAVIPAGGGSPRVISRPDSASGEWSQRWPHALADERTVLYEARGRVREESRIAVVDVNGTNKTIIDVRGASPLGMVDGQLLYATARDTDLDRENAIVALPFDLRRRRITGAPAEVVSRLGSDYDGPANATLSREGSLAYLEVEEWRSEVVLAERKGSVVPLLSAPRRYLHPRFSPDGRRIALTILEPLGIKIGADEEAVVPRSRRYALESHVYVFEIGSGSLTRIGGPQARYPEWTPDGQHVVLSQRRDNHAPGKASDREVWPYPLADGAPRGLLGWQALDVSQRQFTPNGIMILRVNDSATMRRDLFYVRLNGDSMLHPFVQTSDLDEYGPRVSPDGRWVAYWTEGPNGRHVHVTAVPGPGPRHKISLTGGAAPVWSPDGRRLYYVEGERIVAATISWEPEPRVVRREVIFESGFDVSRMWNANYDVSPNGRQFVLMRRLDGPPRVTFVRGWRRELRSRMSGTERP